MARVSRHHAAAGKPSCKGAFITSPATSNTHHASLLAARLGRRDGHIRLGSHGGLGKVKGLH